MWDDYAQAYYYLNTATGETRWDDPRTRAPHTFFYTDQGTRVFVLPAGSPRPASTPAGVAPRRRRAPRRTARRGRRGRGGGARPEPEKQMVWVKGKGMMEVKTEPEPEPESILADVNAREAAAQVMERTGTSRGGAMSSFMSTNTKAKADAKMKAKSPVAKPTSPDAKPTSPAAKPKSPDAKPGSD